MQFKARIIDNGSFGTLILDAPSEADARLQAVAKGYGVLEVSSVGGSRWGSRRTRFPLLLFSQEMLVLLGAGLGLVEALEGISEKETQPEARNVLKAVLQDLYQGLPFSTALERHPQHFPSLYVAMVRASEKTSALAEALQRYVAYQNQVEILKKKLIAASIYPLLLIAVGGLVTLFLLGYVVPRFGAIYEDAGDTLPLMSRWLLSWGQMVQQHGEVLLLGGVGAIVLVAFLLSQSLIRARFGLWFWRIPALGDRMRIFQMARFYRTLSMLLSGGIPILQALGMSRGLLAATLAPSVASAIAAIREGNAVSEAMEKSGLVTPLSLRMLRVGEKSGEMGRMMEQIAVLHDEELSRWLDWFTRLLEPLLMIVIGLVIGAVVMMLYMPIFDLAGSLQ
jgi:general secretion pathway protein F